MKLDFLPLDKLYVDKANMRFAKRPPDVSDILPSVRKRGILQTLIVRPGEEDRFGILAGARRFRAGQIVAGERTDADVPDPEPFLFPCAILEAGDDAAAIEASLIENMARLAPDEVTRWESFVRLVK
jgi:ParB family chromosome partitioning protein